MKRAFHGLVLLTVVLGAAASRAEAPKVQIFEEVEKGLEVGLHLGGAYDFDPPIEKHGPGLLTGLELGYDLTWVFRIKGGFSATFYSGTFDPDPGQALRMDYRHSVVWAGASLALLATQRFYVYVQAAAGYLMASPKQVQNLDVAGKDDVAIMVGGGIEYYPNLRHISVALEANVSILPGRGDVAIAIFPVIRYTFGLGKVQVIKPEKDRDNDGVPDNKDECPETWGADVNRGCPEKDTDGDGVIDREDQCPEVPGPKSNGGCPIEPDTDNDGVKDKVDRCPSVPGPANKEGCPDRDDDGVYDHIDKCPDQAGKAENDGCPSKAQIKVRVKKDSIELREKIHFEFGKDIIKRQSFGILEQVAATLKQYPDIKKLRVEGHTDNKGPDAFNMRLSQRRAEAVVNFLVKQGIERERLVPEGFGESRPISDNRTERGRSANRRVEMIILERE